MNSIIICEGKTDGILISYGLITLSHYTFVKSDVVKRKVGLSFPQLDISWYAQDENYIGIVYAGGNDFGKSITQIIERNKYQFDIDKILVITDHDDITAESDRLKDIENVINSELGGDALRLETGIWNKIDMTDDLGQSNQLKFYYMLIPEHDFGAMETFVVDSLRKMGDEEELAAEQVERFIDSFKSEKFLKKRRERVKAKLSVLLSVISPDRTFTTIDDYLKAMYWSKFEGYKNTFKPILDV